MLIASPRHTAADLALWQELECADRVHGASAALGGKVQRSLDAVRRFAASGPCYAAVSGGKDSTAVVGLLAEAGLLRSIPLVWFRAVPKANPDVSLVLAALRDRFGVAVQVVDYRSPVPLRLTSFQAEEIASANFARASAATFRRCGRRILGVRADESHVRRLKMRRWGLATASSLTPLGWWKSQDVFGYLAVRNLPVHPVYAMLGGGLWPREVLRIDALLGEHGDGLGRREWEQHYYEDVLNGLLHASVQEGIETKQRGCGCQPASSWRAAVFSRGRRMWGCSAAARRSRRCRRQSSEPRRQSTNTLGKQKGRRWSCQTQHTAWQAQTCQAEKRCLALSPRGLGSPKERGCPPHFIPRPSWRFCAFTCFLAVLRCRREWPSAAITSPWRWSAAGSRGVTGAA